MTNESKKDSIEKIEQGYEAREMLLRMVANFPGFILDADVNGADLVEWISHELFHLSGKGHHWNKLFIELAEDGSPCGECGQFFKVCKCRKF